MRTRVLNHDRHGRIRVIDETHDARGFGHGLDLPVEATGAHDTHADAHAITRPLVDGRSAVPTRGHGDDLRAQGFQAVYVGELQHCGKTLVLLAVFLELRHERAQLAVLLLEARDLFIDIDGTDVCEGRRDDGADLRDGLGHGLHDATRDREGARVPKAHAQRDEHDRYDNQNNRNQPKTRASVLTLVAKRESRHEALPLLHV